MIDEDDLRDLVDEAARESFDVQEPLAAARMEVKES
jgi:hypothetical protein